MMRHARRGTTTQPPTVGPCGAILAALAVAVAFAAPFDPAPDGPPFPEQWAAHAQAPPPVKVGALMAPGDRFDDTKRIEALRYAVDEFNRQNAGSPLELAVHNITRGEELDALRTAYANGAGPSYYIGPTTSKGLSSIMGYANSSGIVLVSPASDAAPLAVPGDTTFRLTISVDNQARALARIMSNASIDAAVTVIRDDTWGRSFNSSLNEALDARGIALGGSVAFADSGADWRAAALSAAESAAALPAESRAGIVFAGFGADYRGMAAAVAASRGGSTATAASLPWFAPSAAIVASTLSPIANATVRDFSASVNLTALGHNAPANAVTSALDANLSGAGSDPRRQTYYEYAAYDSLFVLGTAIGMVRDAAGADAPPDPRAVAAAMPAAALAHEGALGRIALNPSGDLLYPDAFSVWRVNGTGGWVRAGTAASGTPVTEIGMLAILAGGHENNRVAAARLAVNDHNWAQDGSPAPRYLHLSVHNVTVDDSPPRVLDALRAAHAGGTGPSYYVGPSTSGNTKRVLDYANERGVVIVSPSATAPSLSIEGDNLFRLAPDDSRQGVVLANVIGRDLASASPAPGAPSGTVVVVARDDAWGGDLNRTASARLAELGIGTAHVAFSESADWPEVARRLASAIGAPGGGDGPAAAVLFIGLAPDFRGIAPLAGASLPWYGPDSIAASRDVAADAAASAFADAVNLTATLFHAAENAEQARVRAALAGMGVGGLRTYDYSTYDSVRVLGAAIGAAEAAAEPGDAAAAAAAVAAAMPRAAAQYEGALGDIALNPSGDLLTPNDYALWAIEGGEWKRLEVFPGTPVVGIGAIVSLDGMPATDAAKLEAMRLAADEYNRASEAAGGPLYVDIEVVRTSLVPAAATPSSPAVLDALAAAHANGSGPSYYVGPTSSANAARVLAYADANNITLVSPSSTAASLAIEGDALFRLAPNDALQGRVLADVIHNRQGDILAGIINGSGAEAVVALVRNDTWGLGLAASASERLASHGIAVSRIVHPTHGADWPAVASRLDSEIASLRAGGAGVAVLHVGFQGDFAAIAGQAAAYPRIASAPWYGTDGIAHGRSITANPAPLAFAEAVNLTGTSFDPPDSPKRDAVAAALEARGVAGPGAYVHASYDAVFVLAGAVERAIEARGSSYSPADVRGEVRAAAAAHVGALGDIELNRAGDLRSPNGYATWRVEDGAWARAGGHPPTPVFKVGALLVLGEGEGAPYSDERALAAAEAAIDDFNTAHELVGDFYLGLEVQKIRATPGSDTGAPGALAGLEALHAGGNGTAYHVGPTSDANAARALGYADRNGLVLVSPSSSSPSLAVPGDALFRMALGHGRHAEVLAGLLAERGATDVVIAARGDAWGSGVNATLRAELGERAGGDGGTPVPSVAAVAFAEDDADWEAAAREIGAAARAAAQAAAARDPPGAPAVVFAGFEGDFAAIAAAAQAASSPSAAGLASAEWMDAGGIGAGQRVLGSADALALARAVNLTTIRPVAAGIGADSPFGPGAALAPQAYDSVRVLGDAIRAAHDRLPPGAAADPPPASAVAAEMRAAARAYSGALGNVTLDASGDLAWPASLAVHTMGPGGWGPGAIAPPGAGPCPDDARCIVLGELYEAELAEQAREIHEAYAMAAADFNRMQAESGASPRLHVALQRAEVSLLSPLEGLAAAHAGGAGPSAYVGPITSASAIAMKPLADSAGIVLVSPASTATTGGLASADTLFRLALSDRYEADLLAMAAEREGVDVIVPAVRGDAYGLSYESELRAEGRLLGIEVADAVVMAVDEAAGHGILDARAAAAELARGAAAVAAASGPGAQVGIVVASTAADLRALAGHAAGHPALAAAKWFEPGNLYPPRPIGDAGLLALAGAADVYSTSWDVPRTDRLNDVHDRLAARIGAEPHAHSYAAYDAVLLLADAIGRSAGEDGSYAGADVAAQVPGSAARLGGLLGGGIVLDEHGDRASPSGVVLWRADGGAGAWQEAGRLGLDPFCAVALRSPSVDLGDVRAGGTAPEAAVQYVRSAGTAPLTGLAVQASPWTLDATGAEALPSGATQVAAAGLGWSALPGAPAELAVSGGISYAWNELLFRLDPAAVPAGSAAGPISQTVTYAATCG